MSSLAGRLTVCPGAPYVVALGSCSTSPSFVAASSTIRAFEEALESCARVVAISAFSSARVRRSWSSSTLSRRTSTLIATMPASSAADGDDPDHAARERAAAACALGPGARRREGAGCAIVDIRRFTAARSRADAARGLASVSCTTARTASERADVASAPSRRRRPGSRAGTCSPSPAPRGTA